MCDESLLAAVEWGCTHKLLLGSDFPIANTGEADRPDGLLDPLLRKASGWRWPV